MNKGKPSGFKADTKKDAGAKSSSRPRRGQAGAGPEWTECGEKESETASPSVLEEASMRSGGDAAVNPFPELRNGASSQGSGRSRIVQFELAGAHAQRVCIAGTFNDWHPDASEMIPVGDGKWRKDLTLSPGEYEYRFVVDGEWRTDPGCHREKPNNLGGTNSVLLVPQV
jgi:hypothetical protein